MDCALEGGGVLQITLDALGRQSVDIGAVTPGPHKQPKGVTAHKKGASDGGADKPGRAGNEGGAGL